MTKITEMKQNATTLAMMIGHCIVVEAIGRPQRRADHRHRIHQRAKSPACRREQNHVDRLRKERAGRQYCGCEADDFDRVHELAPSRPSDTSREARFLFAPSSAYIMSPVDDDETPRRCTMNKAVPDKPARRKGPPRQETAARAAGPDPDAPLGDRAAAGHDRAVRCRPMSGGPKAKPRAGSGAMSAPLPKPRWWAALPTGSPSRAIFRRPLGLPIPHTAVIPRNKDRIGDAVGRFIADNFLQPELVAERVKTVDLSEGIGKWLADPQQSEARGGRTRLRHPMLLDALDDDTVAGFLRSQAAEAAQGTQVAPAFGSRRSKRWPNRGATRRCSTPRSSRASACCRNIRA